MIVNQDLHNKIANLDNYIGKNHDATAFIYFKVKLNVLFCIIPKVAR